MKIVLAFDSFKGSRGPLETGGSAREGILRAVGDAEVSVLGVADGGEGTLEAFMDNENVRAVRVQVSGPLGDAVQAAYAILPNGTAVIELAQTAGLTLIEPRRRDPLKTTTLGMGELIAHALKGGARKFLLALGGSATNDGGTGLLHSLGWRFLDKDKQELFPCGGNLERIEFIDTNAADAALKNCAFEVACDVDNPLCGPRGAAQVYAPQKGANAEDVARLDKGLAHYAQVVERTLGIQISDTPGAGAAGGVGGACLAFLKAQLRPGIDCVLDALDFDEKIRGADWVVTGEGRTDAQSLMGKAPQGIARRARAQGIPAIVVSGGVKVPGEALRQAGICAGFCTLRDVMTLEQAMEKTNSHNNMADTCEAIFGLIAAARK